ncbi:MAG: hypothetical protein HY748_04690 [Elusimicrobia bacterium]|nr:hypothetical protein [Elusimicrobiota bacterium]
MRRRVVVTGLGVVSALGNSKETFWRGLVSGDSGFSKVRSFSTKGWRTEVGAEVRGFSPRNAKAFALHASREALKDAGLDVRAVAPSRAGVALGTTTGEFLRIETEILHYIKGRRTLARTLKAVFPHYPGSISAAIGRRFGFRGPHRVLTTACSAGNAAIAFAIEKIAGDQADLMLAGGVDVFSDLCFAGFNRLLAVAPEVCAPFSKDRKGLIPGEGCAVLALEELESARKRDARIYAELLGYGVSSDALHPTVPDAGGIARAIAGCLAGCGLSPAEVDYISAHGTGTDLNDRVETAAIRAVLGDRAALVPVSSIKSMLGHAMGAASALEAAACCLSIERGVLPPTMNHVPGDPECDLDYVPNKARKTDPKVIVSNAFAFGGSNAVIALAKPGARPAVKAGGTEDALDVERARVVVTGLGRADEPDPLALAEALLPDTDLRYLDRPMAYALAAAKRAFDDAGLDPGLLGDDGGVILDASGELDSLLPFYRDLDLSGPLGVEPRLFPNVLNSAAANRVAIVFGLRALSWTIAGSHPGGESALVCAADFLRRAGRGVFLAGSVQADPVPPAGAGDGRPSSAAASGSAFMMVVETLAGAGRRSARVIAELEGYEEGFDPKARFRRTGRDPRLEDAFRRSPGKPGRAELSFDGWWGGKIKLKLGRSC